MIKTILVPATGSAGDDAVFATALALARPLAAHVDFLHVRIDGSALALAMTADGGGPAMLGNLSDRLDQEAEQRERQARVAVEGFCRREGLALGAAPPGPDRPSVQWLGAVGREPDWITEYGRAADLIVIGRPGDEGGLLPETIETVLLDSGRPLLIPGAAALAALPETIAIAWKPAREAARAVAAAMPLIVAAKSVVILTVAENEAVASAEDGPLMTALGWHGVQVSARHLLPDRHGAPDTLLAAARDLGALLVMGGYGHSRLREWVFGGFTRRVLEHAEVPILIAH